MIKYLKNFFLGDSFLLLIKGFTIGAANIIPGLSGGTIAFISGIYEKLLESINLFYSRKVIFLLFRFRFKEFLTIVDVKFLLLILIGIIVGIFSVSKYIELFFSKYPFSFFSFLFGLMLGAALILGKEEKIWTKKNYFYLLIGCFLGLGLTFAIPQIESENILFVLLSGIFVAGAMIIPGISGSYILLITGNYERMIAAINSFNLETLFVFASGFVIGLIVFSFLIKSLIVKFRKETFSLLVGLVLGSLKSLWPVQFVDNFQFESGRVFLMLILITSGLVVSVGTPVLVKAIGQKK